jgi:hypothetical protein
MTELERKNSLPLQLEVENKEQIPKIEEKNPDHIEVVASPADKPSDNQTSDSCFLKYLFTTGEVLFYPFLALILSTILNIFGAVVCIVLGVFGFVMLAFIPFACVGCCCGDSAKEKASIYMTITFVLIVVFFSGIFTLVLLPFIIIYDFIMTYVKICRQDISWRNPIEQNLSKLLNDSKRMLNKTYNMTVERMKTNK